MLNKKQILEWIDQASLDNYIPELQDTFGTEWIEKLKEEIISGRFDAPVISKNGVEFKFAFGDKVWINDLQCYGRVLSCWHTRSGKQYELRYFIDGKHETSYLFEDELSEKKP